MISMIIKESESIALNALFRIAQPIIITAGEDHYGGEEQEVVVVKEEEGGNFTSSDTIR